MRLLVISDTHGDISKVCKVVNEIKDLIDGIIHLGDIVEDADKLRSCTVKFQCTISVATVTMALMFHQ